MEHHHPPKSLHAHHTLVAVVLIFVLGALAAYTYLTVKKAQYLGEMQPTISVSGNGEVFARPDVAVFTFSVQKEAPDAEAAQAESAELVNAIMAYLTGEGIAEKDIKTTNYNLNPRYEYEQATCLGGFCPPGERVFKGYSVNQSVQVKVRAVDTAGSIMAGSGERGATNISGLNFTIDDESEVERLARQAAIADAQSKAKELADDLGVSLVRVIGFNEGSGSFEERSFETKTMMAMDSAGGDIAPEIPVGENTFTSAVSITYEVR